MTNPATITCGDRTLTIHGDPADFYFQHAQVHADDLAPLQRLVERHVPSDGLIVDVGANIGLSTLRLALARPGSRVLSIEPSPVNVAYLRRNLAANGITNVDVIEAAVSDQAGSLTIHLHGAWTKVVSAAHMLPGTPGLTVPVVTLDGVAAGRGPVAFIKIDTEGHEPHVLAGARMVLERDRPLMLIEFHSWCLTGVAGISPAAFAQILWERFEVRRVDHLGGLPPADDTAHDFLHANLTQRGLVEDLALRLRPGAAVPKLEQMSLPAAYAAELDRLRAANAAVLASTSWRLTAPLRQVVEGLRRGRR